MILLYKNLTKQLNVYNKSYKMKTNKNKFKKDKKTVVAAWQRMQP